MSRGNFNSQISDSQMPFALGNAKSAVVFLDLKLTTDTIESYNETELEFSLIQPRDFDEQLDFET